MQKVISFLILAILAACNPLEPNKFNKEIKISPTEIELDWGSMVKVRANGSVINPDSVNKPETVKAKRPETHSVYSNIHPVGVPKEHTITEKPHKIFPGKNSEIILKTNVVTGKKVNFNYPEPIAAMPVHFSDNTSYDIRHLNIDQGMSSSYVRAVLEDSRGNLWIGTFDKGVSLYDGEHFTHFTEKEGLSSNTINTIFEDSKGNIWFGTWGGGTCMYNGEYFTHFTEKEGLPENHIYSIFEDRKGNIWFGTEGQGICVYDGKQLKQFSEKNSSDNDIIRAITQDINGDIWFATYAGGLKKYSISKSGKEYFVNYTEKEGLSDNYVWTLYADKKGNLWIGSNKGLDILHENKFTHYTTAEGLNHDIVTKIIESRNGDIIIGTRGMGASIFNGKSFTYITKNEGLGDNIVTSIIEDKKGVLWFGTRSGGLHLYNPNSFSHLTEKNGLNDYPITSVAVDQDKNLWIGTSGGGLSIFDNKNIRTFTNKEGLSHNYIYSILEDKNNNIWIGTAGGGVCKYTKKGQVDEFTHFGKDEGLSDHLILAMLEAKNGNIWFSTKGEGVYCYNGTNFTNYNKANGLNNNTIFAMLETHKGEIWFGTYGGGINIYDGENFKWFTPKEGLSDSTIFSLFEDSKNNIWIGTENNGISRYNEHGMIQITEKDGLNSNLVGAIIEDKNHNLWFGTNKGLNLFQQDMDGRIEIIDFEQKDGLKNLDFSNPSLCLDKENRILWANGKNITIIDPDKFKTKSSPPKVSLQNIDINQEHIDYRSLSNTSYRNQFSFGDRLRNAFVKIAPFTNYPINLKLPYNINHLTFHFTVNNRLSPHKIKYSYIMQGLDREWSIPDKESKADYRNIPFGKYTFKVRAIGKNKIWSNSFEYAFTIQAPWWISWWAYLLYFTVSSIFILLIVKLRTRQLQRSERALEKTVTERTKEIERQKEQILTQNKKLLKLDEFKKNMRAMIVHDLKTPLNNILSLTNAVEQGSRAPSIDNASLIKQMGKQMLNLTLNILDINKFEEAKVELQIKDTHLKTLVNNTLSQIVFLADQKNIQVKNLIPDSFMADCDKEIIERVLVNLLTNAIKHSLQNEEVLIECKLAAKTKDWNKKEEYLIISVSDHGEGIAPENTKHIFDKFAQVSEKSSGSIKSTGLGLTFCKLAVEAHGGKIGIHSQLGAGSRFWFTLKKSIIEHKSQKTGNSYVEKQQYSVDLSDKDVALIKPILEKLQDIQFYEVTTIKKLLQEFDFSDNIALQEWKHKLEHSVLTCNKQKYEAIIGLTGRI